MSHWALVTQELARIRESPFPGGTSHSREFENRYLDPEQVKRNKIVPGIRRQAKYSWKSLMGALPLMFTDWRSVQTDTGIGSDPTLATAEKGEPIVTAAVARIGGVAREFRGLHIWKRRSFTIRVAGD